MIRANRFARIALRIARATKVHTLTKCQWTSMQNFLLLQAHPDQHGCNFRQQGFYGLGMERFHRLDGLDGSCGETGCFPVLPFLAFGDFWVFVYEELPSVLRFIPSFLRILGFGGDKFSCFCCGFHALCQKRKRRTRSFWKYSSKRKAWSWLLCCYWVWKILITLRAEQGYTPKHEGFLSLLSPSNLKKNNLACFKGTARRRFPDNFNLFLLFVVKQNQHLKGQHRHLEGAKRALGRWKMLTKGKTSTKQPQTGTKSEFQVSCFLRRAKI